jgi:hypothetical protein
MTLSAVAFAAALTSSARWRALRIIAWLWNSSADAGDSSRR